MNDYFYGGYDGYYFGGFDATIFLVLIGALICMIASAYVNSQMKHYSRIRNARGMTGAEAARRILDAEGLYQVQVNCLPKDNGDHYDPRTKSVNLSADNYNNASVTAISVAAHECGHAIQHASQYGPLSARTAIVPVANISSTLSWPLILLGVFLSWNQVLINIGIIAFSLAVLFQLVTLPVEFNASARAMAKMREFGLLGTEELQGSKKVLRAAAMTYVAAAAASILQLLRLILLFGGNSRRRD